MVVVVVVVWRVGRRWECRCRCVGVSCVWCALRIGQHTCVGWDNRRLELWWVRTSSVAWRLFSRLILPDVSARVIPRFPLFRCVAFQFPRDGSLASRTCGHAHGPRCLRVVWIIGDFRELFFKGVRLEEPLRYVAGVPCDV